MESATHGISSGRLRHVIAEMRSGKLVPEDNRGKHQNRPHKIPDVVRAQIRDHIQSYETYESHYCRPRAPAGTRYLSPNLNVSIMFEDFLQGQRDTGRLECEQWAYQAIFNNEFKNLKLCTPKTDTCDECDHFKALLHDATVNERIQIQEKQLQHHTMCKLNSNLLHKSMSILFKWFLLLECATLMHSIFVRCPTSTLESTEQMMGATQCISGLSLSAAADQMKLPHAYGTTSRPTTTTREQPAH